MKVVFEYSGESSQCAAFSNFMEQVVDNINFRETFKDKRGRPLSVRLLPVNGAGYSAIKANYGKGKMQEFGGSRTDQLRNFLKDHFKKQKRDV